MKKVAIIINLIIAIIFLTINISIAVEDESLNTNVEVSYEYKEETNTVIATMISNNELKDTKISWELSEDKKQYTFEFANNTTYITSVEDIYGRKIPVEIDVTQIDESPAKVEVLYEYKEETNTVIATMVSDKELKHTKISWKLSEDKKSYTFEFSDNTTYMTNVEDKDGNIIPVEINVTQINTTKIEAKYEYIEETNRVKVTITSSNGFNPTKVSWTLSEDKNSYTFEFADNTTYTTNFVDKYGKTIPVEIKVTQIKTTIIEVKYEYIKQTNKVQVTMTSNNELKDTKISWELSEDKKNYTFEFANNTTYMTNVEDIYGKVIPVQINVTQVQFGIEKGTYGQSGAKIHGENGGSDLQYLKFGYGENRLFATFCVHGYEDAWDRDGTVLVDIANNFYNRLINEQDRQIAEKWTIYVFPEVNPDGRRIGHTNNGPGRTSVYSKAGKGIDINRCWQTGSEYKKYTTDRNYNGTSGFQAYEAEALRDFMLSHKSKNGKTILVDLHGWLDQLIGDEEICKYYNEQYHTKTLSYGRYGTQYLITWGRENLGAKVALVELPAVNNYQEVNNMQLSEKYINATLEMLKHE